MNFVLLDYSWAFGGGGIEQNHLGHILSIKEKESGLGVRMR